MFKESLTRLKSIAFDLNIKVLETTGNIQEETKQDLDALVYIINFLEEGRENV